MDLSGWTNPGWFIYQLEVEGPFARRNVLSGEEQGETAVFAGYSICRSAIGHVEFLICTRRRQCRHVVFAKSTNTREANKRCLFITQSGITCPSFIYKKFLLTLSSSAEYGNANEFNFHFKVETAL